jgi:hypothetical protein
MGEEPALRGDGADHREMVVGERRAQHGCLAHRGVGTGDERQEGEARLIYAEDGPVLSLGFA